MRTVYMCPRADLDCDAEFPSSGDLDYHLRWIHGYRRILRYAMAWRPPFLPPVGGWAARAAVARRREEAASRTSVPRRGFGPAATTGAARARREGIAGGLRRLTRRH
jgi:hypothetical protein